YGDDRAVRGNEQTLVYSLASVSRDLFPSLLLERPVRKPSSDLDPAMSQSNKRVRFGIEHGVGYAESRKRLEGAGLDGPIVTDEAEFHAVAAGREKPPWLGD